MTNEEAIKFANCLKNNYTIDFDDMTDFCDMAIKALEQQPSEDCISRKKLEKLKRWRFSYDTNTTIPKSDLFVKLTDIKDLPSVTPTQRWIPCSERLPKTDGDYLLFGKVDEDEENYIFVGEYDSCGEQFGIWVEQFDRTTLGCLGSEFYEYASVLAWMPLPKPYKAEMESEE